MEETDKANENGVSEWLIVSTCLTSDHSDRPAISFLLSILYDAMRESVGLTDAKKSLQLFQPRETSTEMNGR